MTAIPTRVDVTQCAQEPIRVPGCIQPHGVLFVLATETLVVLNVSDNVEAVFGESVSSVLGRPLTTILDSVQASHFEAAVRVADLTREMPLLISRDVRGTVQEFECSAHRVSETFIVEFEPWTIATVQDQPEPFMVRRPIERLQAASDMTALVKQAAADIQQISGYDRTMIYRFDEEWHGEVLAERTSGDDVPEEFLGLHFPASDIPEQARQLYLANPIRFIADVNAAPSRIVPDHDANDEPIDLSSSILRSVSPVHLEYLQNMGVSASMSISIIIAGRLWGLVVCHHRRPHRVDDPVRAACMLITDMLAWQLATRAAISDRDRTAATRESIDALGRHLRTHGDLGDGFVANARTVLEIFGAQGMVLMIAGVLRRIGRTPAEDSIVAAIAIALHGTGTSGIFSSSAVNDIAPRAAGAGDSASGALLIDLSEDRLDFVMFFRGEQVETVHWGGNRHGTTMSEDDGRLHPRNSFALWVEDVRGRSLRWSEHDLAAADLLRKLIVDRSKAIDRKLASERLSYLATYDTLTELPNRATLEDLLQRSVREAKNSSEILALLFVDLDHFKVFNDSFGHATGDRILQVAAARLQRSLRRNDSAARIGGDEFIIILRELTNDCDADAVAEKLGTALAEPILIANAPEIRLTASIGIAVFPRDGADADTLLHHADLAMYRVKEGGRSGFAQFAASGVSATLDRLYAERRVREGLDNNEFVAYYQPMVNLTSGTITAVEALARWKHPSRGLLGPDEFIELAEQSGAIVSLGEAMLRQACRQAARMLREFGDRAPYMSVNVSPRQLRNQAFVRLVSDLLLENELPPHLLQLEITEDLLIEENAIAIKTLRSLASSGINIAIDDFGTGYSSLSYLTRLPVNVLKIDKSFITDMDRKPASAAVVRAIIAMSRSLNMVTVAEGVEDFEHARMLFSEGCTAIQGFVVERALSDSDAEAFIAAFDSERFLARLSSA